MLDSIPLWISVPLIVVLSLTALYRWYILPGYEKDKEQPK